MANETKNNTCAVCGCFIDKSSTEEAWTTIIKAKYYIDDDSERGYKVVGGSRETFCFGCASAIHSKIMDLKDAAKSKREVSQ